MMFHLPSQTQPTQSEGIACKANNKLAQEMI